MNHLRPALMAAACLLALALAGPSMAADMADPLDGYTIRDISNWEPAEAASPLEVVEPVWKDLFLEMEPLPSLSVALEPSEDRQGYIANVTMKGYADDSVAGEHFRAVIRASANGWKLEKLGQQNICARGEHAGKPQKDICP